MSSAQLAAAHPVSGGTYEYGYRFLKPWMGFTAGWMFLCAKSASAATAALGFSGYLLQMLGMAAAVPLQVPALLILAVVAALVLSGMRRSHGVNVWIVSITLVSLLWFVIRTAPEVKPGAVAVSVDAWMAPGFWQACALMFVAYTGYGRIATLGEEIRNPERNIPRAMVGVMGVTAVLYLSIAWAAVGAVGAEKLGDWARGSAAPLESVLMALDAEGSARFIALGALTAMVGVLLNLLLGLSRVLLAMGRRQDMPKRFGEVVEGTPRAAVIGVAGLIALLCLPGSVAVSWSFSAFTVLLYYSLTNLAALKLPAEHRRSPRLFSWIGLASCLFLAFQVAPMFWAVGLGSVSVGLLWHRFRRGRVRA
jgi:APA family basic amino acid/polyamine antiporter